MIAKEVLNSDNYSCVVIKNNELKHSVRGNGIKPLLKIYVESISDLQESSVADKIIGKAAASVLICAEAKEVYGKILSKQALKILNEYNIKIEYDLLVDNIQNRDKTGQCPLESLVQDINVPEEAVKAVIKFLG